MKNFIGAILAAVLVAGIVNAAGLRPRFSGSTFSSSDATTATGWTYVSSTYSLSSGDVDVKSGSALYLDGATRTSGLTWNGSFIAVLGNTSLSPSSDQLMSLGGASNRWASVYGGDIYRILGTGTGYGHPIGTIQTDTTPVGNLGASGPDILQTYTLPASSIVTNGRGFKFRAWGTTANNANAKTVSFKFGTATLITKQLTASIAGTWNIEGYCIRTGASAQDCFVVAYNSGGTTVAATDGATVQRISSFGAQTQTETGTLAIATGSTVSTSDNDIVSKGLVIEGL